MDLYAEGVELASPGYPDDPGSSGIRNPSTLKGLHSTDQGGANVTAAVAKLPSHRVLDEGAATVSPGPNRLRRLLKKYGIEFDERFVWN
jgi:hypothetical protein